MISAQRSVGFIIPHTCPTSPRVQGNPIKNAKQRTQQNPLMDGSSNNIHTNFELLVGQHLKTNSMTLDIEYNTTFKVIDSWEQLRRIKDYEDIAGSTLFQSLFAKCPESKVLFGFPITMDPSSEEIQKNRHFITHSKYMIQMLDKALNMLGPDLELLAEILVDLGKKHVRFGVKPEFFPLMGEALLETLSITLKDMFTTQVREAWVEVYDALSSEMIKAMNSERAVLKSWDMLKQVRNYKEVAGVILFQDFFKKCPEAKTLFGFPLELDPTSTAMTTSRRFLTHAAYFVEMLETALNMMESKTLSENMGMLGKLHAEYQVKEEYFPLMGESLFLTLSVTLGSKWTLEMQEAWSEVYAKISAEMIKAMCDK